MGAEPPILARTYQFALLDKNREKRKKIEPDKNREKKRKISSSSATRQKPEKNEVRVLLDKKRKTLDSGVLRV